MEMVIGCVLIAAAVVLALVPDFKELRDVRRRLRVARETEEARHSCTHREPARPGLLAERAPVRHPTTGGRADVSLLLALSAPDDRLVVGNQEARVFETRLLAFKRELATRNESLDGLRIERS